MSQQRRYSQSQRSSNQNEDFDLDNYLEEKGNVFDADYQQKEPKKNSLLTGVLVVIAVISSVIWSYNITTDGTWFGFLGSDEFTEVSNVEAVAPVSPIAPIQDQATSSFNYASNSDLGSVTDYLQQLDEAGLLNDRLLNGFEARQIYSNGVPVDYLVALNESGYLADFSFVYINEYYNNQIPLVYLDVLDNAGYLTHFSFVSVIELYKNDVPIEYLKQLEEGGYLFDLSFVYITEYYKNGVTTEFLDELKSKNLYDNLSFVDVVELYKAEEN